MAVIVRNTFLDIADHKFLQIDAVCASQRRCHSVPRSWKLERPTDSAPTSMASPDASSRASLISDLSFFSPMESLSIKGKDAAEPEFWVPTRRHWRTPSGMSWASTSDPYESNSDSAYDTSSVGSPCDLSAVQSQEHDQEAELSICRPCGFDVEDRTQLKIQAPAFQSVRSETREDAVVNAVHLALKSCGRADRIKIDRCSDGRSSTLISAEVDSGASSYEVLHLAKGALEAITAHLSTVALMSARVQKEESGYSLRSSIAYVPQEAEDKMCWDLFQRGCCPRRGQCRWYHPQSDDMGKIKISIRCAHAANAVSDEKQSSTGSSAGRRTISLGDIL